MDRQTKPSVATPEPPLSLAGGFAPAGDVQWRKLVDKILAGADFDKTLVSRSYDGLAIKPLYTSADWPSGDDPSGFPGGPPFIRGNRTHADGWDVRQMHADAIPSRANAAILDDLAHGATSIVLKLDTAGVGGTAVRTLADLDAALAGVHLDAAPVVLDSAGGTLAPAALLMQLLTQRGVGDAFAGNFGVDEFGALAAQGALSAPIEASLAVLADLASFAAASFPKARAINVRGSIYHAAGASEAQELACALATAVAYLRALSAAGLDIDAACGQLAFTLAADADFFLTIAKFRAFRKIFARAASVSGAAIERRAVPITAVTASRMMTRRDPWVNVLRGTVAGFAAGVAGADAVTVLPFDTAIGEPSAQARRIARNTNTILLEEAHLGRVADPAGGAWLFERLTDDLAEKAWASFRDIERRGGMATALASGFIAETIAATQIERARNIATRKDALTGVSEYPNIGEPPVTAQARPTLAMAATSARIAHLPAPGRGVLTKALLHAATTGASIVDIEAALGGKAAAISPLKPVRLADGFERLRDAADIYAATHGARPRVFLANLGSAVDFGARAMFARGLFEAGGIESVAGSGGHDGPAIANDFRASGARLAVICGTDAAYQKFAAEVASALKQSRATVYLAGRPAETEASLRAAGVHDFIFRGCDVLKALNDAHAILGRSS